jgi:hypothetical protein
VTIATHPDFYCTTDFEGDGGGFSTRLRVARSGARQASPNRTRGIREWTVTLEWLKADNAKTWVAFFGQQLGSAVPFHWYSPHRTSADNVRFINGLDYVDGDGTTTAFDLPYRDASATPTFHINGGPDPAPGVFNKSTSAYPGTSPTPDSFTFSSAPSNGAIFTTSYVKARERIYVAFSSDKYRYRTEFRDGENQTQFQFGLTEVIKT